MVGILNLQRQQQRPSSHQRPPLSPVKRAMQSFHSYGDWLVDQSISETWNESSTSVGASPKAKQATGACLPFQSLVSQLESFLGGDCGGSSNSVDDDRDIVVKEVANTTIALREDVPRDTTIPAPPSTTAQRESSSGQLFDVPLTPVGDSMSSPRGTEGATASSNSLAEQSSAIVSTSALATASTEQGAIIEAFSGDCNLELARSVDATAAAIDEFITPVPDTAIVVKSAHQQSNDGEEERALANPSLDMIDLLTNGCPGMPVLPVLPAPPTLAETTQLVEASLEASMHSCHAAGDAIVEETLEPEALVEKSLNHLDQLLTPVPDAVEPMNTVPLLLTLPPSQEKDLLALPASEKARNDASKDEADAPLCDDSIANSVIERESPVAPPMKHENESPIHDDGTDATSELFEDVESPVVRDLKQDKGATDSVEPVVSPEIPKVDVQATTAPKGLPQSKVPTPSIISDTKEDVAVQRGGGDDETRDIPSESATTDVADLQPVETPDYEISDFNRRKILGEGQFGQVWLVTEKKTKAPFALKILSKYDMVADDLVGNLVRETTLMRKMQGHPFIAQLIATFQDDRLVYLLEEFCQGGELFSVMHDLKKFTSHEASFYTNCLARALCDLHNKRIVFRDLKPENIVLDVLGYPKLIDFGYAKELEEEERTTTFCGTPRYLAPEIVAGVGHNFAVDNWALGVLIYEFLTGENPFFFDGMDEPSLFDSIQNDDFAEPDIDDEDALDLITKLLVKDPRKRMTIADVIRHPWLKQWDFRNDILSCSVKAPWVPTVQSRWDTNCFDNWSGLLEDRTLQHFPKLTAAEAAQFAPLQL